MRAASAWLPPISSTAWPTSAGTRARSSSPRRCSAGSGARGRCSRSSARHIRPDIVTLAKPLGGGLPLGAVLLREELAGEISVGDHGSTFGGNPVAAAASLVVLDRLTSDGFLEKVEKKGRMLGRELRALQRTYREQIARRPRRGPDGRHRVLRPAAPVLVAGLRARGILATRAGDNVLRLLPPLVVKRNDLQSFLVAFEAVLKAGAGRAFTGAGGAVA